jgi:hypothetical protein
MIIPPVRAEFSRQTDMTKLIVAFRKFVNAPKIPVQCYKVTYLTRLLSGFKNALKTFNVSADDIVSCTYHTSYMCIYIYIKC